VTQPGFNQIFEEAGRRVAEMWASIGVSRALLSQTVTARRLPEDEVLSKEAERQTTDDRRWRKLEAAFAAEVARFAEAAQRHKLAFDRRDQPNGLERLIGHISRGRQRRLTEGRWRRLDSFDELGRMMRKADALYGLLTVIRQRLQDERRGCEGDLARLAQYRPDLLPPEDEDATAFAEAVDQVEASLGLFGALPTAFNGRIASCNALLHKLMVETEEVLILYRVLADGSGQGATAEAELSRLVHLSEADQRFRDGRLIGRELDRLREDADAGFFRLFPRHAPPDSVPVPAAPETPPQAR
jgi:hypothetical protein